LDVTGWDDEQLADGAALLTEIGRYGPGGRAHYEPRGQDPGRREPDRLRLHRSPGSEMTSHQCDI
jgi:hypothetical protein